MEESTSDLKAFGKQDSIYYHASQTGIFEATGQILYITSTLFGGKYIETERRMQSLHELLRQILRFQASNGFIGSPILELQIHFPLP